MLTFIKLDDTHILYGDVMFERRGVVEYIHIVGLNKEGEPHIISDQDGSIWYGLCSVSVILPRQKTDE